MANRAPINLDELRQKIHDEKAQPVQAGDKTFWIKPPELLTDEDFQAFTAANDSNDIVAQARLVVDDYDGFVAAGGSAILLAQILGEMGDDEDGSTAGEDGASSGS